MTFGAGGVALAFIVVAVAALLLMGVIVGLVMLVVGSRRGSRGLARAGGILVGLPFVLLLALIAWGLAHADPDTLELDLTAPIAVSSLDADNKFPAYPAYTYDSDRVDLQIAGGRFESEVDTITLWFDDDVVTKVRLRRDAETPASLRALAAEWSEPLGLPDDGLEEATAAWTGSAGQEWTSEVGGRRVSLDITSRDHAIVWASIDVPDGAIR